MTGDPCPRRAVGTDLVPKGFPVGVLVGKELYERLRGRLWSERYGAGQSRSAVFWYFLSYRWLFKINSTRWISVFLTPVNQSCGGERWWKRDRCKVSVQKEKRWKFQRLPQENTIAEAAPQAMPPARLDSLKPHLNYSSVLSGESITHATELVGDAEEPWK